MVGRLEHFACWYRVDLRLGSRLTIVKRIGSAGLLAGFYETAGIVKVFVFAFAFAFAFSLLAFLFLLLLLFLPFLVPWVHLGLLYALAGSRSGLGA
jgi:hypothetical protein